MMFRTSCRDYLRSVETFGSMVYSLLEGYKFRRDCHLLCTSVRTLTKQSLIGIGILVIGDKDDAEMQRVKRDYVKKLKNF